MDLPAYLQRIQFRGEPRPDLATLKALHRQHLLHIPYENLDVQLGRPLDLDPAAAFDKLVRRRRGGWCYEMNGLLRWALETVGFEVLPMTGAIRRDDHDEVHRFGEVCGRRTRFGRLSHPNRWASRAATNTSMSACA